MIQKNKQLEYTINSLKTEYNDLKSKNQKEINDLKNNNNTLKRIQEEEKNQIN